MSYRMDAFHQFTNTNNGYLADQTCAGGRRQSCGGSDVGMMISAFLNIGGQVAMMAMQAKAEAKAQEAQTQNQTASNNNKAIKEAMGDAQSILNSLPSDSMQYANLKNELTSLESKIDAVEKLQERKDKLGALQNKYKDVSVTVNGKPMSVSEAAQKYSEGTKSVSKLRDCSGILSSLVATKNAYQEKVDAKIDTPFSDFVAPFSFNDEGEKGQAVKYIEANKDKYFTTDEKGNKVPYEVGYEDDLAKARGYDEQFSAKLDAKAKIEKIEKEDIPKVYSDAMNAIPDELKSEIGEIKTPEDIDAASQKVDQYANEIGNAQIATAEGETPVKVLDYARNEKSLNDFIEYGEKNKDNVNALTKQQEAKQKELDDAVKPKMEKIKMAYNNLKVMVERIDACEAENTKLENAKQGQENIKDNEGRSGFQKMFGLGVTETMKQRRSNAEALTANQQEKVQEKIQKFVDDYGVQPNQSLRGQAVAQMEILNNAYSCLATGNVYGGSSAGSSGGGGGGSVDFDKLNGTYQASLMTVNGQIVSAGLKKLS